MMHSVPFGGRNNMSISEQTSWSAITLPKLQNGFTCGGRHLRVVWISSKRGQAAQDRHRIISWNDSTIPVRHDDNPYRAPSPRDTYGVSEPRRPAPSKATIRPLGSNGWKIASREWSDESTEHGLVSPGFFTRMWAVFGYMMLAIYPFHHLLCCRDRDCLDHRRVALMMPGAPVRRSKPNVAQLQAATVQRTRQINAGIVTRC